MGFWQSAHYYTGIRQALGMGKLVLARTRLVEWRDAQRSLVGHRDRPAGQRRGKKMRFARYSGRFSFPPLSAPWRAIRERASAFFSVAAARSRDREIGDLESFARRSFAIIDWLGFAGHCCCFRHCRQFRACVILLASAGQAESRC